MKFKGKEMSLGTFIGKALDEIRRKIRRIWRKIKFQFSKLIPDKLFLINKYKKKFGKKPNLDNPVTYNEKLNWQKLYDKNPLYPKLADKIAVRDYVKEKIGEEYLVPLIGVWDKPEDINFDELPDKFVLKCTHDSESVIICKDKSKLNKKKAIDKLKRALKVNFYYYNREWVYKNIPRKVICEQYLEDAADKELRDYKIFSFDGVPTFMFIATDRAIHETKFDFYDMDFNHLPFTQYYPNSPVPVHPPVNFELMKELTRKLSAGICQCRVDFYEVNGRVYFGEITFFHHGGTTPFDPEEWDYKFGELIKLPAKK